MNAPVKRVLPRLVLIVAVAVIVTTLLQGRDGYTVSVPLENAFGLQSGSNVRVGGVDAGKLSLDLDDRDRVVAKLELDEPVGKDARVSIVAANFLGAKRLVLERGDVKNDPAPNGFELSGDNVRALTDLDQLLSVFDAPTRVRAQIMFNEAGRAVMGRSVDVRTLLKEFPFGLDQAGDVVRSLSTDNATMERLIERSDRFVGEAASQREKLVRLIDGVGQTAVTVNARRDELRATLARAPRTLARLRMFTDDLVATTRQLQPAARELTRSSGPLSRTLAQVEPLRRSAEPTLRALTDVSPDLVRLADGATPVLRRAAPTLRKLARLGGVLPPVTDALDGSFANTVAVLENWSQAIQFRDNMSHVFRGAATFSPDTPLGVVEALTGQPVGAPRDRGGDADRPARRRPAPPAAAPGGGSRPPAEPARPQGPLDLPALGGVGDAIEDALPLLGGVGKTTGAQKQPRADASPGANPLLDLLLGP